jgi:hypothetical protein
MVIVLAREDAEVHLRALLTMTEQFQVCEWGHCRLGTEPDIPDCRIPWVFSKRKLFLM